ncbi:bifunctional [glutamate--ammonia ligase]-adenylyl-L-tyrosine phosphorylase/[glutamate--ammonia-ligase] adenylyltransferase [Sphingomonas piscis]|uniref:Bifunctional [glutamate--ammonia ligase]-adenylyl-L-tyrosine phosphorylase/[glutamate--ammonia-ligase] adenylyltransferase n=1 Tax=Sphingomonas piscis TaxID=2714943 RepID=A0A6G7YR73_9SPHN|nr:bifunctional [glutamate--ammonia ligase]-adenylyl-L-tyrosine phosphorylase/[glutamate--ammonia-ligase] adenylyltransferase [Sphingomonas piscis]QIK79248.1 bifunctional [glutamate--ammonia ligase]-adenylyl-L-tyrosine phosphorylase/[glutamate--ammonia-ligase] adenylyltransferase [Sphingomonas piscis]
MQMNIGPDRQVRANAVERARSFSPFLRAAAESRPEIVSAFVERGSEQAISLALQVADEAVDIRLRRQRLGLALAVALGDLSAELSLEQVTAALSDFADTAIDQAITAALLERAPDAPPAGFAAIALGKLGSSELNYSSDVDLLFLFDPETLPRHPRHPRQEAGEVAVRIGRRVIELLQARTAHGYAARVDLRLRPSPEATPIALPVNAAISYYESSALAWERAAFIRARAAAGDKLLGQMFLDAILPFVWRRSLDFGAIEEIRQVSVRIRDHYEQVQAFGPGYDLKRGRGGIREAEFFTQVQQLIHGGREPALRVPATLDALTALTDSGHMDADTAAAIGDAYRLLRTVEHRAQMIADQQTHRLPLDRDALDQIARLDGSPDGEALLDRLKPHVGAVGRLFDGLVSETGDRLSMDPQILQDELTAMGFAQVEQPAARIAEWRAGKARALRSAAAQSAFEAMLPTLMRAIASGPDPDHALNRFADIVERLSSGVNLFRLLEARPGLARDLALILSHAPILADQLARRPDLLDGLIDQSSYELPASAESVAERLRDAMAGQPYDQALDKARRLVNERRFALGVQLIAGRGDALEVAKGYSDVAEGTIVALADIAEAEFADSHGRIEGGELLLLALGRLAGQSLTHVSDLDIVYIFDAPPGAVSNGRRSLSATDYYNRLANRITAALSVPTAAGPLYDIDTRLRPQGVKGMLAVSLDGFVDYQRSEAWTWEHMALCRARPVRGTQEGKARLRRAIDAILTTPHDPAKVRADSAQMRLEMARHKPATGPLDIKLGPGGLVDLEFAIHTLQLISGAGLDPRLERAIAGLAGAGLMDAQMEADLCLLARLLVVLRLVAPSGGDPPPQSRELIARQCGYDSWDSLLEAHGEARQRIAELWLKVRDGK